MLVNFMLIGAQKCGTTTLHGILESHPSLSPCTIKEPQFFCTTKDWRKEVDAYHEKFDQSADSIFFESSTTYTFLPTRNIGVWEDIYAYNPDMKFIYVVRKPIDAVISRYMHYYERGLIDCTFEEAIINDRVFIDFSRYFTQISPYIERFGRDNVLVLDFHDLNNERTATLKEVASFLDIDFSGFKEYESMHRNISVGGRKPNMKFDNLNFSQKLLKKFFPAYWDRVTRNSERGFKEKPKPSTKAITLINTMMRPEIDGLESIINKDLTGWRT
ncbi:sulfotransferase [Rubellicoccus peritrichatus]|uniref:Sulfotransferase n=1 Tax=Rubellicoccus peritrichatus TaxID=3080537 RepID=A0AAQ3LD86_9BACT|nr:sulfotransferase [Puniceicoccus sp. CR14]WOO41428.1 sulfotransferase [Puniceicoccus sp. CR14]